jgi:hypothetical protein
MAFTIDSTKSIQFPNKRSKRMRISTLTVVVLAMLLASSARNQGMAQPPDAQTFRANLVGDNEVPPINTKATATLKLSVGSTITFTVTYANLSTPLLFSHFHFAPTKVAGGVMIFLCGGGGQPTCPQTLSGSFSGTITAANVTGPTAQGIAAGDLTSALEAVGEGNSYINMHTTMFPGGELRGQIERGDD